ncbi:ABC transporter ATP-binding protein [Microbacterium sp. ARD32]|uniref:ABC transporter ATP-binding protein n=1 Tax=Microbacterium sp. ARD32 TaxID=2962577 RepID=UPI0028827FA5|nr:ABC transporter ATP-binding protein [Microbacterium sp. ARD32]MDT0158741.1 ABC transporter ATP-binding protein [Microbacterium sp. ARD32]
MPDLHIEPSIGLKDTPASEGRRTHAAVAEARSSWNRAPLSPSFDEGSAVRSAVAGVDRLVIAAADGTELVHGVSLSVRPGEALGVVGESGSGKTLTCRALLGILPPGLSVRSGTVRVDGRELTSASERDWRSVRGTRIGAVFQDPASYLNPAIPVGRQLQEVLRVTAGVPKAKAPQRARELLDDLGIRRVDLVLQQHVAELSGGMLQRVLIAMALAADPAVLIADEATTALDVTVQAELLDLLARLRRERELALIIVSHDLAVVAQVCERVLVFRDGRVVEGGATSRVLRAPAHAYTRSLLAAHTAYGLERFLR